eukprot:6483367-Prymnesium_polylepis.1
MPDFEFLQSENIVWRYGRIHPRVQRCRLGRAQDSALASCASSSSLTARLCIYDEYIQRWQSSRC